MALGDAPSSGSAGGGHELSIDALEQEITTLAAHLSAATYRMLVLLEEFDRRKGWAGWGVKSCAHWLSWKCGVGLVAAREKLRVARALPSLPMVSEAMAAGRLSYSKVRAITRIAGPHNQSALLSIGENGTATHVERAVRYYRQSEPKAYCEREAAAQQQGNRRVGYYWDHDGCLVVEGRLPPEQGALFVRALEAAEAELRAEKRATAPWDASAEASPSAELQAEAPNWGQRQSDALALLVERSLADGEALAAGDRHLVQVHVDLDLLRESSEGGGCCQIEDGPALARDIARRLACDGGLVTVIEDESGQTLDVGRKTRAVPPATRRALDHRDQGCRFPGCTCSTRYTDAHHIVHWADGGETRLGNLILICRYHHRLLHEGGFTLQRHGGALVFRTPAGREIPTVPRAVVPSNAGAETLQRNHAAAGLTIDARTAVSGWGGEAPDYSYLLTMLEQREARRDKG